MPWNLKCNVCLPFSSLWWWPGKSLDHVSVIAMNSSSVRVRFTLPQILVGLVGHAELVFTTQPTLLRHEWNVQRFARPNRLFDTPNIEYHLNNLRPDTTYYFQIKIVVEALHSDPESEIYKLRMPPEPAFPMQARTPPSTMRSTTITTTIIPSTSTTTTNPPSIIKTLTTTRKSMVPRPPPVIVVQSSGHSLISGSILIVTTLILTLSSFWFPLARYFV